MTQMNQGDQIEPFFITEEVEAEMEAKGYTFEPPNHARTTSLPEILAGLPDEELARWRDGLVDQEREKRINNQISRKIK